MSKIYLFWFLTMIWPRMNQLDQGGSILSQKTKLKWQHLSCCISMVIVKPEAQWCRGILKSRRKITMLYYWTSVTLADIKIKTENKSFFIIDSDFPQSVTKEFKHWRAWLILVQVVYGDILRILIRSGIKTYMKVLFYWQIMKYVLYRFLTLEERCC